MMVVALMNNLYGDVFLEPELISAVIIDRI